MSKTFLGIIFLIMGVVAVISPNAVLALIEVLVSVAIFANGLFIFFATRRLLEDKSFRIVMIVRSVISILTGGGVAATVLYYGVDKVQPDITSCMAWVLTGYFIFSIVTQIFGIVKLHKGKVPVFSSVVEVLISVGSAVVFAVLANPNFRKILMPACGAVLIIIGIISLLLAWRVHSIKKTQSESEPEDEQLKIEELKSAKVEE